MDAFDLLGVRRCGRIRTNSRGDVRNVLTRSLVVVLRSGEPRTATDEADSVESNRSLGACRRRLDASRGCEKFGHRPRKLQMRWVAGPRNQNFNCRLTISRTSRGASAPRRTYRPRFVGGSRAEVYPERDEARSHGHPSRPRDLERHSGVRRHARTGADAVGVPRTRTVARRVLG